MISSQGGSIYAGNPGTICIEKRTVLAQAAGNFSTATWASGRFRQIDLTLRQLAVTGGSNIDEIKMVGLTGTYNSTLQYSGGPPGIVSSASKIFAFGSAKVTGQYLFDIPAAPALKSVTSKNNLLESSPAQQQEVFGKNDDTTHEVTGLIFVIATDVVSFSYELYGIP